MTSVTRVVALLMPQVTQLDLTGPLQVLSRMPGVDLALAWHRVEPVMTDAGFAILPTSAFDDAPDADVLFVPGGQGAFDVMDDEVVLEFVRRQAGVARYITSVCTGSFVLGAAGLLRGRRATSHWGSLHLLAQLGALPVTERVVRDGRFITGAGVSSGIDFALTLVGEMSGPDVAREIQLAIEYDPQPPFDAGSPRSPEADPRVVERTLARVNETRGPMVARAASRLRV